MPGAPIAFLLIPLLIFSCSRNNVTIDNSLSKVFDSAGVTGSFGLFDNTQGHFTIYNLRRYRDSAYLPGETFDIMNSLIGIQTGIVKDDSAVIHWDPAMAVKPDGPNDQTLRVDFQSSSDLPFAVLARRIGQDTLKKWIDSLGYGNKDLGGGVDQFWQNGHLKITADEELGLVKKLYFDQLPFYQRTQRIVRSMMEKENNANYSIHYKTSQSSTVWNDPKSSHAIGWVVGWIEENKHPYFFVLNIESGNMNMGMENAGIRILRSILEQMGFFEGKK
jgi:beta-lactamase class D